MAVAINDGWGWRVLLLAMCLLVLAGCASTRAARDKSEVVLADHRNVLTEEETREVLDSLITRSESEMLAEMIADLNSLSRLPVYKDTAVELLIDGPETYASMLEAIDSAQHFVYLETYIFDDDEAGWRFARALSRKAGQGVDVRIVYDSIGSSSSGNNFFEFMEKAGIRLVEFNRLNPIGGGNPLKINNRNHRKLMVVDNQVAYTGGINLSSTYASSSTGRPKPDPIREGWRDTHVAIRGPAAEGFTRVFLEYWSVAAKAATDPLSELPPPTAAGSNIVAILTAFGGDGEESAIFEAYIDAMKMARERIWITQAYFAPDEGFLEMLHLAAQRGIDVRLLVPGFSDSKLILNASRSRYADLLEHGVRIFESQYDLLHAKTAVIDGLWSTVGSSNLDYRSFLHNDEINAIILGERFGAAMETQFLKDLEHAREIRFDEWQARSVFKRIGERLSWFLEYWL